MRGISVLPVVTILVACRTLQHDAAYHPKVDAADFQTNVDNPWFPLIPGTVFKYVEMKDGERTDVVTTVTFDVKTIANVPCIVVHDVASKRGEIAEDTLDWYAQDKQGNVWYFGEDTKSYQRDGKYSTEGSWEAGVKGAQPGIVMPHHPAPGNPYRQEYLAGHAEDMAQIVALNESVTVPFGVFVDTVRSKEWSELEAGSDQKWYARDVGFVRSSSEDGEVAELVSVSKLP